MIDNLKKIKILDSIILRENLGLLKHRISNSYPYVKWILLIVSEKNNLPQIKTEVSPWADKIHYFFTDDSENIFNEQNQNQFNRLIKSFDLNFEDILTFSEISELPNFQDYKIISEELVYEPIVLRNTNFIFNLSKHTKSRHMGTLCTNYSMILKRPEILLDIIELKKKIISDDFNVFDSGYHFDFFCSMETMIENFHKSNVKVNEETLLLTISKALSPRYLENNIKLYFTDFESSINFNTDFLIQYFYDRKIKSKNLILFNVYQERIGMELISQYDRIFNFNFSNDYKLEEISFDSIVENVNLFLPNKYIYDTGDYSFNLSFGLNETKKILNKLNLLNEQNLDVCIFEKGQFNIIESSIFWKDLKNKNFVDTFYEQLVPYI